MALKQNVTKAFVSPPLRWVNFSFASRTISPVGYYYLLSRIHSGRLKVKVDGSLEDRALYDPSTNTIKAIDDSFGETYLRDMATLIHEGAHAILDILYAGRDSSGRPSTMLVVDDETIGYLADAIYLIAANVADFSTSSPKNEAIKVARPKVAASMARGWDGTYTMSFTRQEVSALRAAIKTHRAYKADWNQTAQHDG